jgi:hypothetical protein
MEEAEGNSLQQGEAKQRKRRKSFCRRFTRIGADREKQNLTTDKHGLNGFKRNQKPLKHRGMEGAEQLTSEAKQRKYF